MERTSNNKLYILIKAMSKSEKGYFKKVSTALSQKANNNYLLLFETIDKLDVYDEEVLKKKLVTSPHIVKQLPVLKSYLYQLILKVLRTYHSGTDGHLAVLTEWENVRVLTKIKQFDLAYQHAVKAEQMIGQNFSALEGAYANAVIRDVLTDSFNGDDKGLTLNGNFEKQAEKLISIPVENELSEVYANYIQFYASIGVVRSQEDMDYLSSLYKKVEHYRIDDKNLSFKSRYHIYYVKRCYLEQQSDFNTSFELSQQWIELFKLSNDLQAIYQKEFTLSLFYLYNAGLRSFNHDFVANELTHLPKHILDFDRKNGYHFFECFIELCMMKEDAEKTATLIADFEENNGKSIFLLSTERYISLKRNLMLLYFFSKKFELSLKICDELLTYSNTGLRQNLLSGLRVFKAILFYKQQKYDLVESAVRSAKYYLTKTDDYFEIERLVLNKFSLLLNLGELEKKSVLIDIRDGIDTITSNNTFESNFSLLCDVLMWLEAEINGIDEIEAVKIRFHKAMELMN